MGGQFKDMRRPARVPPDPYCIERVNTWPWTFFTHLSSHLSSCLGCNACTLVGPAISVACAHVCNAHTPALPVYCARMGKRVRARPPRAHDGCARAAVPLRYPGRGAHKQAESVTRWHHAKARAATEGCLESERESLCPLAGVGGE